MLGEWKKNKRERVKKGSSSLLGSTELFEWVDDPRKKDKKWKRKDTRIDDLWQMPFAQIGVSKCSCCLRKVRSQKRREKGGKIIACLAEAPGAAVTL